MAPARPYARARLRGLAVASTGVVLAASACRSSDAPAAAARPDTVVTVRDAAGSVIVETRITGGRCAVTGAAELIVDRSTTPDGPLVTAQVGATVVLTMTSGRISGPDGAPRARVVHAADRIDVIDPSGVALARISGSAAGDIAAVVDAGRAPVASVRRDGAQLAATSSDGAALAQVTGTADLELAALLIAPGVPADLRALIACDRLLAVAADSTPTDPAVPDPTP